MKQKKGFIANDLLLKKTGVHKFSINPSIPAWET